MGFRQKKQIILLMNSLSAMFQPVLAPSFFANRLKFRDHRVGQDVWISHTPPVIYAGYRVSYTISEVIITHRHLFFRLEMRGNRTADRSSTRTGRNANTADAHTHTFANRPAG
jgi:hypothetical protein